MLTQVGVKQLTDFLRTVTAASDLVDCTLVNCEYVAKTKALISLAVTAKLICVFVFAYAKSRFSHEGAQMTFYLVLISSG